MALTGDTFCGSAVGAIKLLSWNSEKFALVDGLGAVFCVIGKSFVTVFATYFGWKIV